MRPSEIYSYLVLNIVDANCLEVITKTFFFIMIISQNFAEEFAREWLEAWNSRNLEAILRHYSEEVVFSSPLVRKNQINESGSLHGKQSLGKYFALALEKNPDLHFDLQHILLGIKSITLIYLRKKTVLAAEVMILNEKGLVVEGLSHYPLERISSLP